MILIANIKMYILGISAFYHDSAAVLIKDGRVITAIEEERFSHLKHDNTFPIQAINFCLKANNLDIREIDYIAYYEKPLLKFERLIENFIHTYPFALKVFLQAVPEWLDKKIKIEEIIRKTVGFKKKIYFISHHYSHAASAYFTSSFKKATILTIDGVGEYQTTGLWLGEKNQIQLLKRIDFPDSIGLLYSTFTAFLGFRVNEDEYKLMGLAAYGKPRYKNKIYRLIDIKNDGSFRLEQQYFDYRKSLCMYSKKFIKLFGFPRQSEDKITQFHKDLAASIQAVTEEIYFKILNYLHQLTNIDNLCISGGVALNALANGKIYTYTPFKKIHIFGAAGDSGAALGAGLLVYNQILPNHTVTSNFSYITKRIKVSNLYFGSRYTNQEIEIILKQLSLKYTKLSKETLILKSAELLAKGYIIGWFQGRCEFGPRALGNRSILCKPSPRVMKTKVNSIKKREQFRPFAGSILQEKVDEYFVVPEKNYYSPFMTFCFPVKKEKRKELAAIVHADGTCRIQTVNKENGLYYKLIKRFYEMTGIPCLLNTSFNLKGEPIVENPKQAIEDFLRTKMDYLVLGEFLLSKID